METRRPCGDQWKAEKRAVQYVEAVEVPNSKVRTKTKKKKAYNIDKSDILVDFRPKKQRYKALK